MKRLVVDCCVREDDSYTRMFYSSYTERQTNGNNEYLFLYREKIAPLTSETLSKRTNLCEKGDFNDEIFRYAKQFAEADEIVIGAPYWDLSFPSVLKIYVENICVPGITFKYVGKKPVGLCKAKKLLYFSTCGGFFGEKHFGYEYIKNIADMLGIKETENFFIQGLDLDPLKKAEIATNEINRIFPPAQ